MSKVNFKINSLKGIMYKDKPKFYIKTLLRYNENNNWQCWGQFCYLYNRIDSFIPSSKQDNQLIEYINLCMHAWMELANELLQQINIKYFSNSTVVCKIGMMIN